MHSKDHEIQKCTGNSAVNRINESLKQEKRSDMKLFSSLDPTIRADFGFSL